MPSDLGDHGAFLPFLSMPHHLLSLSLPLCNLCTVAHTNAICENIFYSYLIHFMPIQLPLILTYYTLHSPVAVVIVVLFVDFLPVWHDLAWPGLTAELTSAGPCNWHSSQVQFCRQLGNALSTPAGRLWLRLAVATVYCGNGDDATGRRVQLVSSLKVILHK